MMNGRSYLKLKGCPKCNGDILVDNAIDNEEYCLQCGYRKTVPIPIGLLLPDRPKRRVVLAGRRAGR